MKKQISYRNLEDTLVLLGSKTPKGDLTLERILKILSGKGRYLLVILLSIPFCLPLHIPGLSIPFGLVIAFIGLRIAVGRNVWLPQRVLSKKISGTLMRKISHKGLWIVKKIRGLIHPRLEGLCRNTFARIINGTLISFLGILLALPLPIPFSNLTVAWSLFVICIGLLEDDGAWVIAGYVASLITLGFFLGIGFVIKQAI